MGKNSKYTLIKLYVPELKKSKTFGVDILALDLESKKSKKLPIKLTAAGELAQFGVANVKYHDLSGQPAIMRIMLTTREDPRCPYVVFYRRQPFFFKVLAGTFPYFLENRTL